MKRRQFKFSMTVPERIFGFVMLPLHVVAIPLLVGVALGVLFANYGIMLSSAYMNLMCYAVSAVLVFIFMFKFLKKSFVDIFDDAGGFLGTVAIGLLVYFVLIYVVSSLLYITAPDLVNPNTEEIRAEAMEDRNVIFVLGVILAPIIEECIFRGAVFGTLRTKSRTAAYIVSVVLFSVYHMWSYLVADFSWLTVLCLLQYLPTGIVLAWSYERSGTIWAPILIHAVINVIALSV